MIRGAAALALLVALALPARANPVDVFGFGARGPAMGSAQTAAAVDGGANYHNPAILASFPDVRIDVGYQYANPELAINDKDVDVDNARGIAVSLNVPGRIGGARVAFGGGLFIPDERISRVRTLNGQQPRFQMYDNRPQRLFLAANLAAQLSHRLYVGGGISYMSSTAGGVDLVGRIGFPDAEDSDLALAIDVDLKTVRYGQLGALWRHNEWLDIGVSYRTQFKLTLEQEFTIVGDVGPANNPVVEDGFLRLLSRAQDLFQPAQLSAGFAAQLTPRLLLAFDATWHRWSRFTNPAAEIELELDVGDFNSLVDIPDAPPLPEPNFSDILVPRLGLEWLAATSEKRDWLVRAGYVYEPSPVPRQVGETNFVDSDKHTLSVGGGVSLRQFSRVFRLPVDLDAYLALTLLEGRSNRKLSPVDPVGDYRSSGYVIAGGLGSRWRF